MVPIRKRVATVADSQRKSARAKKTVKGYLPTHMTADAYSKGNNRRISKAEVAKHTGIIFGRNIGNPWLSIVAGGKRKNAPTKPSYPGADVGPEFYAVTFPPGWRIRGGLKQYQLLDAQNRVRGEGFYLSHLFASVKSYCFYRIRYIYNVEKNIPIKAQFNGDEFVYAAVFDGEEKEIKRFGLLQSTAKKEGKETLLTQARKWLKASYPNSDNIWAYW